MDKAFILKYRPLRFADLDLTEVRERLQKMMKSGKVAHALLFAGPRGTGKTSAARLVAKAVNCEKRRPGQIEPCGKCEACESITKGRAVDLLEIDGASNRGIDDIRELREKVKLAPARLKNKVYIIDEVHMLTNEAFNALLKTLEEPPARTIFILATTDPEKLPATIVSRCVRFNFRRAEIKEMVASLERVVKGEKIKVENGVLEAVAKAAEGSFRDAHKLLDQLSLDRKGEKITLKTARSLLGQSERVSPEKLLEMMAEGDLKTCLSEIGRLAESGVDFADFNKSLLERLRLVLLRKVGVEGSEEIKAVSELTADEVRQLLILVTAAGRETKSHPIPQLPLELAVVEWSQRIENSEKGQADSGKSRQPDVSRSRAKGKATSKPGAFPANGDGIGLVQEKWADLMRAIGPMNHSIEALLRATRPLDLHDGVLTLEVFYRFHKERLEEAKIRDIFEKIAEQVLMMPVRLKCVLGQKPVKETEVFTDAAEPLGVDDLVDEVDIGEDEDIIKAAEEIFGN